jgi:hypothetical protein
MTRYFVDSDAVLAATSSAHGTIARVQADIQTLTSQLQALQLPGVVRLQQHSKMC